MPVSFYTLLLIKRYTGYSRYIISIFEKYLASLPGKSTMTGNDAVFT